MTDFHRTPHSIRYDEEAAADSTRSSVVSLPADSDASCANSLTALMEAAVSKQDS